jgi:hypothetical protein
MTYRERGVEGSLRPKYKSGRPVQLQAAFHEVSASGRKYE